LQTEGGGGDFVKVAWRREGDATPAAQLQPITGSVLQTYVPLPPPRFNAPVIAGGQITISWTGGGVLLRSTNLSNWEAVPGNPASPYVVNASGSPIYFYRVIRF
jgi:hypothetical protein